jgi:NAD(P)H-hydrate epimerase
MKILTAAEMGAADKRTAEGGLPLSELMLAAGGAVAEFCLRRYPLAARVMVLCGKGNNGGDGFVAARVLAEQGVGVRVLLLGAQAEVQGEALDALRALKESTSDEIVEELPGDAEADELEALLEEAELILDAVLGTGFKPPLRGAAIALRDALNRLDIPVVAVDLPSGWDADSTAETVDGAFRADAVVTFTAPKQAHVFGHLTGSVFGPVVVAPIGSPDKVVESAAGLRWAGAAKKLTEAPRAINSNKGKFGHVLVVGGSYGTTGAPSMASLACLRAGAGLVTAAVPRSSLAGVAAIAPELMLRALREPEVDAWDEAFGTASVANLEAAHLEPLLKGIKVIALGPGLSTRGEASAFARGLVRATKLPLVLDADGLNAFDLSAEHFVDGQSPLNGRDRTLVLTPHPGEMARLVGKTVPEVEADRINIARAFATEHQVTLVLKGWRTLIAHPDGSIAVNTTGNPGLAKGGSGDILTGIVAAMLAQYPAQVAEAVEAAVYLHGLAADLAVSGGIHEKTLLATDVIDHLSAAFHYRAQDADGLTWICGIRREAAEPAGGLD